MHNLFGAIYKNKTVLITGHTGFKGSWLTIWLEKMGAKVIGYSLEAPTNPNHFKLLNSNCISVIGDIRDSSKLDETFETYQPDIVFHLAAQPLVKYSYDNPIETYETNVIGTLKVFEACKKSKVKAIVNITSDKAYENKEWIWGYKEIDSLGGYDPYSSSKACAEILTDSYRNSYFNLKNYTKTHNTLLASCRAGNVIGGGDWGKDRLIPDAMITASENRKVNIRNPKAIRPWQHVLEALSGYLNIGQKLLEGKTKYAEAWNFGPNKESTLSVEEALCSAKKYWNQIEYEIDSNSNHPHEANILKLDCSKAYTKLHWKEVWDYSTTFEKTVSWYKEYYNNQKILTNDDLESYIKDAKKKSLSWIN